MAVFLFVAAAVALLAGLIGLVVGHMPQRTGRSGEHEWPLRHHPHGEH
jgi:hypothetical protein